MAEHYAKTPKGIEEISQRSHSLGQHLRRLLILVDGKRRAADFAAMLPGVDTAAALQQLLSDGFIAPLAAEQPAAATAAAAAPEPPRAPRPESDAQRFEMAHNFMLNTLNAFVGIAASSLINRIEAATTIENLQEHYLAWRDAISLSADGRKRLQELEGRLAPLLS